MFCKLCFSFLVNHLSQTNTTNRKLVVACIKIEKTFYLIKTKRYFLSILVLPSNPMSYSLLNSTFIDIFVYSSSMSVANLMIYIMDKLRPIEFFFNELEKEGTRRKIKIRMLQTKTEYSLKA